MIRQFPGRDGECTIFEPGHGAICWNCGRLEASHSHRRVYRWSDANPSVLAHPTVEPIDPAPCPSSSDYVPGDV